MFKSLLLALGCALLSFSVSAKSFEIEGHRVETSERNSESFKLDGQDFSHGEILLRRSKFIIPDRAAFAKSDLQLFVVQFESQVFQTYRDVLKDLGAKIIKFVPEHSLLIEVDSNKISQIQNLIFVKQVLAFGGEFKALDFPQAFVRMPRQIDTMKVDILSPTHISRYNLTERLKAAGVRIVSAGEKSFSIKAVLTSEKLIEISHWPEILWIEPAPTKIEEDMDLILIQGGADYLTQNTSDYRGEGIRGHVLEGINPKHQDFQANNFRDAPIPIGDGSSSGHGHATYGIIYGSGKGDPKALGLMPRAQGLYTHFDHVMGNDGRYQLSKELIENHQVMLQTASWGYAPTTEYNARSLEMDEIIFDLDFAVTQSQSNTGNRRSRPQAWAKNIISVGAVHHGDNLSFDDDSWSMGGASIGPASDGRIKPDIVSYYDDIYTTGLNGYRLFGGTSGATPVVNGHLGLIIEMFTDGIFGNELTHPISERFLNRPHAATAKALLINSARQYQFDGLDHDLTRVHQGWGQPDLRYLYDNSSSFLVVDEQHQLKLLETRQYKVSVETDAPQLRVTMVYNDPPGVVGAKVNRVNDLNLKLTSPNGTIYFGNAGLDISTESVSGGKADRLNTVENVFISQPEVGEWTVEVTAAEINQDGHVETADMDVDYALVVSGINQSQPSL